MPTKLVEIPDATAVLLFHADGTLECRIPGPRNAEEGQRDIPEHILVATAIANALRVAPELLGPMLRLLKKDMDDLVAKKAHGRAH